MVDDVLLIGLLAAQARVSAGNSERRERKEVDVSCCTKESLADVVDVSERIPSTHRCVV